MLKEKSCTHGPHQPRRIRRYPSDTLSAVRVFTEVQRKGEKKNEGQGRQNRMSSHEQLMKMVSPAEGNVTHTFAQTAFPYSNPEKGEKEKKKR